MSVHGAISYTFGAIAEEIRARTFASNYNQMPTTITVVLPDH